VQVERQRRKERVDVELEAQPDRRILDLSVDPLRRRRRYPAGDA
jgi:hypothetical protein